VWQMFTRDRKPISSARTPWTQAIDLPGASQMQHLRRLIESRPFLERRPAQELLEGNPGTGAEHVRATRGDRYAFVYIPTGKTIDVKLGILGGKSVRAAWFDPRTGKETGIENAPNEGVRRFDPPGEPGRRNDWILTLDSQ
jgi:hypothetical protein